MLTTYFVGFPQNGQKGTSACIWVGNYCCMVCNTRLATHGSLGSILCHILSSRMSRVHDINVTPQTKLSYASTENSLLLHCTSSCD